MKDSIASHILKGKCFISTRPKGKSEKLDSLFNTAGAELIELPMIDIKPIISNEVIASLNNISDFNVLLFTSANAVHIFMDAGKTISDFHKKLKTKTFASVGKKTSQAIEAYGHTIGFLSPKANSKHLAVSFKAYLKGKNANVLWPTSNLSNFFLEEKLAEVADFKKLTIYKTDNPVSSDPRLEEKVTRGNYDLIYFFSPSAFLKFHQKFCNKTDIRNIKAASIGPTTTDCMRKLNLAPLFEAKEQSEKGMFAATVQYFETKK